RSATEGAAHPVQVDMTACHQQERGQRCGHGFQGAIRHVGAATGACIVGVTLHTSGHLRAPVSGNECSSTRFHSQGHGYRGRVPAPTFGVYVHVPFCAARCGYCDFNTYTASELAGSGASPEGWLEAVRRELSLAAATVRPRAVDTVFVGGGTPSLL